ncbi:uncharacterized protein LOC109706257 [Ananas comosus]|uniref:Uncharacterized protein LOC109706257 n=1 Tax=Ananas comosus TaxID=4615 RepID=A0A6P5EMP9_ANACO|nr:uncharacterized protein LOC109706257 [Ananas comosus]
MLTDLVTQQAAAARQQMDAARRQEDRMKRLEDLLLQQTTDREIPDPSPWWVDIREDPRTDLSAITWNRFKELLLTTYFPQSVKRQMEKDLRNLRQGDRTVAEYEREFSRLLHCVPSVVRDDEDKARIFEVGLRPAIFRLVEASNLSTYKDVVNRVLIVEKGAEIMKERDIVDRSKGKRPTAESSGQQSFRRPPKYPRG